MSKEDVQKNEVQKDNSLHKTVSKEEHVLKKANALDFVQEIKTEFSQITWTPSEELKSYTKIVVGSTFVLGLGVYIVDLAIQTALNTLTWITRITLG